VQRFQEFCRRRYDIADSIAYGTEKQRWLKWVVSEFVRISDGKPIKINLIPMGSLEVVHVLLSGDQRIHVGSPASAAYKDIFVQEWQVKYNDNPIVREERLRSRRWCS
jgi:hypothetical protein